MNNCEEKLTPKVEPSSYWYEEQLNKLRFENKTLKETISKLIEALYKLNKLGDKE